MAGILGGFAVWVSLPAFGSLVLGGFIGGIWAEWTNRRQPALATSFFPWRTWSLSGGITVLLAYVVEYFPAHMEFQRMEILNPLYGLAWIAVGELMIFVAQKFRTGSFPARLSARISAGAAMAMLATITVLMEKTGSPGIFVQATTSMRLTPLAGGVFAPNLWGWVSRDGAGPAAWATLLPLLLLLPAGWILRGALRTPPKPVRAGSRHRTGVGAGWPRLLSSRGTEFTRRGIADFARGNFDSTPRRHLDRFNWGGGGDSGMLSIVAAEIPRRANHADGV